MKQYAFARYHPAVNFMFFLSVFFFSVIIQHPAYLIANVLAAISYCFVLRKKIFVVRLVKISLLLIFITFINPLINTRGENVMFRIMGRPYTFEALLYGFVVGVIFVVVLMWLDCCNLVLTGDKFVYLFSGFMPTISLLIGMSFRMIQSFKNKAMQIIGARISIGKGIKSSSKKERIKSAASVFGVLVSWVLEDSVITSDSMKARGYGEKKRSSFKVYHMTFSDWLLIIVMGILIGIVTVSIVMGKTRAEFVPKIELESLSLDNIFGYIAYCLLLVIPILIHMKEKISWSISEYKI